MQASLQLSAPLGFRKLVAGRRYHVIHEGNFVTLASFEENPPSACLTSLEADEYAYAKDHRLINILSGAEAVRLPPWHSDRENEPFEESPNIFEKSLPEGEQKKWPDRYVVDRRVEIIADAVDEAQEIFCHRHPEKLLNKFARKKRQNEPRFRLWVITYLAFGRNRWALLAPNGGRGKYDREALAEQGKKTGRPHRNGAQYGCGTTSASKALMVRGFKRYAKKGMSLAAVHARTLVELYKVGYVPNGDRTKIVRNERLPFPPEYATFRACVLKALGHKVVWTTLLGDELYRNLFAPPAGSYTQHLQDLLERVMSDAACGELLPKSYLSDAPSLPLYQVECIDVLSGLGIGIAFGVGSEREALYSQCMASVALPKSMVGRVLNVEVSDDDYPVSGWMPLASQTDQGKGATKKLRALAKKFGTAPERSPAYSPQSQATVEAGHADRSQGTSGAPTHKVSDLTPLQMARNRFREFMSRNRSKSVANRLTPERTGLDIQNPIELWKNLRASGRIIGNPVKPVDVITGYLPKVKFKVVGGHLTRHGVVYRPARIVNDTDRPLTPEELVEIAREVNARQSMEFSGYHFEISNLVEWVVIGKQLVEVHCIPRTAEHLDHAAMTQDECEIHDRRVKSNASTSRELRTAERVRNLIDGKTDNGTTFLQSTTKKGQAHFRTPAAKAEAAALKAN